MVYWKERASIANSELRFVKEQRDATLAINEQLKWAVSRLLIALLPFRARHKQDRCECNACDDMRDAIDFANAVQKGKK